MVGPPGKEGNIGQPGPMGAPGSRGTSGDLGPPVSYMDIQLLSDSISPTGQVFKHYVFVRVWRENQDPQDLPGPQDPPLHP